jgi:hypothetical protein
MNLNHLIITLILPFATFSGQCLVASSQSHRCTIALHFMDALAKRRCDIQLQLDRGLGSERIV